jgi:hypothetical protein
MKTTLAIIIMFFFGVQFASAQQPAVQAPAKVVTWNEQMHDFGKITQNAPTIVAFEFTNETSGPIVITAARSSCGCTVAEYTKEPVKPGEKGEVKATYNSARVGSFAKTITVTFDGIEQPEVLTIKGEVEIPATTTTTPTTN